MTKEELTQYCDAEFKNIDRAVSELFSICSPDKTSYPPSEIAAISTFVLNTYSGMENILKQMLTFDNLNLKESPAWHEELLKKTTELGILPRDLSQVFAKYLSFRNFFIYSYAFNINWEEIKVLVDPVKDVVEKFRSEIYEYIQTIELNTD